MRHVTLIVAVDKRGAIGCANRLPWRLKSDMRFFREATRGGVVIIGRKSFESIGKPLAGRYNIILSRNQTLSHSQISENSVPARSCEDALAIADRVAIMQGRATKIDTSPMLQERRTAFYPKPCYGKSAHATPVLAKPDDTLIPDIPLYNKGIFVIGGGEIYRQFLPFVDRCLISHIDQIYPDTDSFFDLAALDTEPWRMGSKQCLDSYPANPPDDEAGFTIWDYRRQPQPQPQLERQSERTKSLSPADAPDRISSRLHAIV